MTPFEKLLDGVHNYQNMKVFGCLAFAANLAKKKKINFFQKEIPWFSWDMLPVTNGISYSNVDKPNICVQGCNNP